MIDWGNISLKELAGYVSEELRKRLIFASNKILIFLKWSNGQLLKNIQKNMRYF